MSVKKTAALLVALVMAFLAANACALTMTGLETESVSRDWAENAFFDRMEEVTGIAVEPTAVYDEAEYQKLISGMKKGNTPADVLFKADLSRSQEIALLDSGAIIDLAPLMEAHMPNLCALLDAHPQWRDVITLEDGRIPSLPLFNEGERQVCVWINEAWLRQLGLEMPGTLAELTAALTAIRDGDPNGNYKNDEIAADLLGVWEMRWLLPYFGVVADDYNIARVDGAAVFAPELPAYREFVAYLADWYEKGLLPPEAFTDVHSTALYETSENKTTVTGLMVSVTPYTQVPLEALMNYSPLLLPGPDGKTVWRDLLGQVWTGTFAVTSQCENPGEALAWADALYDEETMVLAYAGVEGENYTVAEDGRWSFIVDSMYTVDNVRADVLIYTGVMMPGMVPDDFLAQVNSDEDRHIIEASRRVQAVATQVTPPYALSTQEQARANALNKELAALVDTGIASFVTGEKPLDDENWQAWLDTLRAAGSGEMVELFSSIE